MRPLGVTLAACYEFLRAFLIGVVALGVLFVGGVASRLAGLAAEGNTLQRFLAGFGKFVGVALFIYAAIQLLLGAGLLLRQNWARLAAMFFSAIGLLLLLPRLLHMRPVSGLFALLNLAVLIYLAMPDARRYFESKESAAQIPA
jgi:hypothetical protein